MVQHALRFMLTHVIWKARRLLTEESETPDASLLELVRGQQRVLVDQVTEFALGTRSNTGEIVKQEVRHSSIISALYLTTLDRHSKL
jgi:hypothetical protein